MRPGTREGGPGNDTGDKKGTVRWRAFVRYGSDCKATCGQTREGDRAVKDRTNLTTADANTHGTGERDTKTRFSLTLEPFQRPLVIS